MGKAKSPQTLAKLIAYILERRPDEFGLVTDTEGYVKVKELLKAINEEPGWKYVRRSHLDEILYSFPQPPFEVLEERIRAKCRDSLPHLKPVSDIPKLLFTCIRRRAYSFVLDKGIFPTGYHQVVLSANRNLAERMGKRSDTDPVMLTVHTQKSVESGVMFYQSGESLFLAEAIPTSCFSGPPLPKDKPETRKQQQNHTVVQPRTAGSFALDIAKTLRSPATSGKPKKKDIGWKDSRKRLKKQKRKRERPPWRR